MIAIIDYGSGNLAAILNVYRETRVPHILTNNPRDLVQADRFILPGVGAFDPTMRALAQSGMVDALNEEVLGKGKRVLGICVGMHLLAESSEEGELPGLGWVTGRVRRIKKDSSEKPFLPHMGWNSVSVRRAAALFENIDTDRGFYFLHSYYLDASDPDAVSAEVEYGAPFPCAVEVANVSGVQFHPEKSHSNGARLFANFAVLP